MLAEPVAAADGMLVNLADTGQPGVLRLHRDRGRICPVPAAQARRGDRPRRPRQARRDPRPGRPRGADPLKRLVKRRPSLFAGLVVCFDRNFPGHELILGLSSAAGGHVIARVKEGIPLPSGDGPGRGWLPDGSRMTWLNAPSGKKTDRLPVRAAEHNVILPASDGKQSHRRPARSSPPCWTTRKPPLTRSATPTSPGGAPRRPRSARTRPRSPAPGTAPAARSCGPAPPRLVISEAWTWLTATRLVRASDAAALRSEHAAARALRRRNRRHGHRRRGILHRRPAPRDPVHDIVAGHSLLVVARACRRGRRRRSRPLHTLNIPGRRRHSERAQKARPKFPHARPRRPPSPGNPRSQYSRRDSPSPLRHATPRERRKPPRPRGAADRGTARYPRRDTRASPMPAHKP